MITTIQVVITVDLQENRQVWHFELIQVWKFIFYLLSPTIHHHYPIVFLIFFIDFHLPVYFPGQHYTFFGKVKLLNIQAKERGLREFHELNGLKMSKIGSFTQDWDPDMLKLVWSAGKLVSSIVFMYLNRRATNIMERASLQLIMYKLLDDAGLIAFILNSLTWNLMHLSLNKLIP